MSTVSEIVERDTEPGEPEHLADDERELLAAEQEPEASEYPAPPPAVTDADMERIGKLIDKEGDRHQAAVAKILGEQMATMAPCPLCVVDGFVFSEAPPDFDPERRMAVMVAMGEPGRPSLKQHPNLYTCPLCEGQGDLLTGSAKETTRIEGCPDCGGRGYRDKAQDEATNLTAQIMPQTGTGTVQVDQTGGQPDPWLRPAGHPKWGQDPNVAGYN